MFGKPLSNTSQQPTDGDYIVRLYKIAHLGAIKNNFDSYSNQIVFSFETICKIDGGKDVNFDDASAVFYNDKGLQPFNVETKKFGNRHPLAFFEELVERKATAEEHRNGFNPMLIVGQCYRVLIGHVTKGENTYTNIDKIRSIVEPDKAAKLIDQAHAAGVTLNPLTAFHPLYDVTANQRVETAAQLVNTDMWRNITKLQKALTMTSKEMRTYVDYDDVIAPLLSN